MNKIDKAVLSVIEESDNAMIRSAKDGANEDQHQFSNSFNFKMEKLYKKRKPASSTQLIRRIVVLAATLVLLVSMVTAAAFWEEITTFFEDMFGTYSELRVEVDDSVNLPMREEIPNDWNSYWYVDYIPSGYSFESGEERYGVRTILFQDGERLALTFKQWDTYKSIANDNDGDQIDGIKVGDFETFAFEKKLENKTVRTLAWSNGVTSFRLIGKDSFDELEKVAESIVLIEVE